MVVRDYRDLISDGEIYSQMRDLQLELPRAGVLLQSVRGKRLSLRDAVYFLLLDSLEKRRHARQCADKPSQAVPAYGE